MFVCKSHDSTAKKINVTLDTNLVDHLKQKLDIIIYLKLNREKE